MNIYCNGSNFNFDMKLKFVIIILSMKVYKLVLISLVLFSVSLSTKSAVAARSLYLELEGSDVKALQETLIAHNYLGKGYNTGYYGTLTQTAVRRFQCDHNIVCSGSISNGYGVYGPQTQAALNEVTDYPEPCDPEGSNDTGCNWSV